MKKAGIAVIILLIFLINFGAASDVAYIYKASKGVDENIVSVFSDLGLTVDTIQENNLASANFNNYKMIFVGDERFRNKNLIPMTTKPTIIANYYFGKEFGLTDSDGISKLASNSPLSVKIGSNVVKVYTQAKYSAGGISIPYYYLDDKNKAPGLESVARTYTGNGNSYNFGDVISYANAGTRLINGKTTQEKICFFGIIESDYWTPQARQLFQDCIAFVGMTCSSDSDCPDQELDEPYCQGGESYRNITNFHCENPGTVQSQCVGEVVKELVEDCGNNYCNGWGNNYCVGDDVYHSRTCYDVGCSAGNCFENPLTPENELVEECEYGCAGGECKEPEINCSENSECGTNNWLNQDVCEVNDIFDYYTTFRCENPGTTESYCSNSTSLLLKENCSNFCANGNCVGCLIDSNCQNDSYSDNYCSGKDVYHDLTDYSCENYECTSETTPELIEECADSCVNGACEEIVCSNNLECGLNGFAGWQYCLNENSYEDFISFTCMNPGTTQSYCSNFTWPILTEYCDFECVSGECIACFNNLSCGIDIFIGENYCIGDDIYRDYQNFMCENPGTSESDCSSTVSPQFIKQCADVCVLGQCKEIECYNDTECDDFNLYTIDKCNNPGTTDSYCSHTPINCINNNDCGTTGFIGEEFCFEDDLFKNYQNSMCINPNTPESYCNVSLSPAFLFDCGIDSCDDWDANYCVGDDVYHSRTCYEQGCSELNGDGCFSNIFAEEELVEECDFTCINGSCEGECTVDADCDDGIDCTTDSCNEQEDRCDNLPNDGLCNDGLFCNGEETCNPEIGCWAGAPIDCSPFNILGISTCGNIPDNNPFTFDYFSGFLSSCDEMQDTCTTSIINLAHNCELSCGAECVDVGDCPQKCTINSHKLYNLIGCNDCECDYSTPGCVIGKCGAVCDSDDDCLCQADYCDGYTLVDYPEYSSCGTAGSEGCLCQGCIPELIADSPECYTPTCSDNTECGTDGWIEDYYCYQDNVYRNYQEFECLFPGTPNSSCSISVSDRLIGECLLGCNSGKCLGCID